MLMQFPASPMAHGLLHALGWTLLHFCWQGTIVATIAWCVLQLLAGRSSQARYAVACLALALLAALPLITFAHIASADLKSARTTWDAAIPIDPAMLLQISVGDSSAPWPARIAIALDHRMPWLLALWLAGALFFVARLNVGLIVARSLKSTGTQTPPTDLLQLFDHLKRRLGVERAIRLLHSARVQVPSVIGWLRPVVLIPASCLTGLSTAQIEAIFCHELAHVRRHDYLVSVFQSIAEALLFYHPAVWWISKQVRRERECCCDEIAVANGGDVLAYARALSYLEERRAAFPEFMLGANGGALTLRIKRLLGCKQNTPASQFAAFTLLALMIAVAGSYVATIARAAQPKAHAMPAIIAAPLHPIGLAQDQPGPSNSRQPRYGAVYATWLNQDVAYIITPEERTAFLALTNDEERDKFIQNFWERRNPTPGSPVNLFKEEHYARIAYANQHFAANKPGWMTDRGRVYIVYGKPNEIDAHPGGAMSPYPYEVWQYPHIEGIGDSVKLEFVDTCQCGEYHYTIDGFATGQGTADSWKRITSAAKILAAPAATGAPQSPPPPPAPAPAIPGQPMHVPMSSMQPTYKVMPIYPEIAKAAHVQGPVLLRATVSISGDVEDLSAISGPTMLWSTAMDAVRQWKYKPYLLNGEPQRVETIVLVNFHLAADGTTKVDLEPDSIRVSAGVVAGLLISKVNPVYPPDAKAAGMQGSVVLRAMIGKDGTVEALQVVSGLPALTPSALDAVKQWTYKPYLLNGQPVEVDTTITVNYSLADPPPTAKAEQEYRELLASQRTIGGNVSAPVVIYMVKPEYTPQARAAKFSGIVLVNLIVDQNGQPQNVHILRGVGMGLDEEAVSGVKRYKFKPAMENEKPVSVPLNIEVSFQLDGTTPPKAPGPEPRADNSPGKLPDGTTAPLLIYRVEPEYTNSARKAKKSGTVLVNLTVDKQGMPQHVHVLRGVGDGLDKKAVEAVKQYRFKPAMKDNQPVEEALNIEINFQIF
jgi:TonB family protein